MSSIIDLANRKIEEQTKAMRESFERRAQELRKIADDAIAEVKEVLEQAARKFADDVRQ